MVNENCGVVGIYSMNGTNVIPLIIDSLRALQHRGQEAWGIAIPGKKPIKKLGLVSSYYSEFDKIITEYSSHLAIGHVRYSTIGKNNIDNAQPLKIRDLCIAHNGTISNTTELSNLVGGCTFTPQNTSDTLLAAKRLLTLTKKTGKLSDALSILKNEMIGSYCFTFLDDTSIYAARDPQGFRPLVVGHINKKIYVIVSESCALSVIDAKLIRDVRPGEFIKVNNEGLKTEMFSTVKNKSHCSFEFTYFAHPSSKMEGNNIYLARKNIGKLLARKFPIYDSDLVIPVPDSARPAALGYAQELNLQFDEGLLKDRYSKKGTLRSFIEPQEADRIDINKWIIPIKEIIQGKHIVIIDDSLVRGTSAKAIVNALKKAGASKISMLITYPPIMYPCYAGIDFPSQTELATFDVNIKNEKYIIEKVRKYIGADFLGYNDSQNLANAIGIPLNSMCFTCSTGNYDSLGIKPKFKTRIEMKG